MSTYVLIHGAGDGGWSWHPVAAQLRGRGHEVVAPGLPDAPSATLTGYADAVVEAVGDRPDRVVVGHSFGGFTAPLVAGRLGARLLVLVAAMIPAPGERPGDRGRTTGYREAVRTHDDPYVTVYHDVPRALADEAMGRERAHPSPAAMAQPWPLAAWPDVPTRFVLGREDRCFPPEFLRALAAGRLGLVADEIAAGHCVALSRPGEPAALLESHRAG
ncbi:alpha/beta hydrolase [Amycolatopsis sp. NPDC004625]|uniref:alpha/beta fold hydrolase n=1 Tax=Amycolatopsis sp. NPDC004625 TaxID=3154670 RepID=UPI0033AFD149